MIEISEEKILEDITVLLMEKLPGELLRLEESTEDGKQLPAFRYAGRQDNLPPGTGLPYVFVEVTEGEYTEKDRIVRNVVYSVNLQLKLTNYGLVWRYFKGIETIINFDSRGYKIMIVKKNTQGELLLRTINWK